MSYYIFLDVDGVLNDSYTEEKTPEGYIGIDSEKIEILKDISNYLDATIILTSDWKEEWEKDIDICGIDGQYLIDKLAEFDLYISDKTIDSQGISRRGVGILNYIREHNIDKYIIFDDNEFDFGGYPEIKSHFIQTPDGINTAKIYDEKNAVEDVVKIVQKINQISYNNFCI